MKIVFEENDEVIYEGERCIVHSSAKQLLNDIEGIHLTKPDGSIVLAPLTVIMSYNEWLLEKCVEYLHAQEQWECDLTTNDEDELLESMSIENYNAMLQLQEMRSNIGRAISAGNKRKN